MHKAIVTKYIGQTNYKPSRIKATCAAKSLLISYDSEFSIDQNHHYAAMTLRDKMLWGGDLIGGVMPNGDYAWVNENSEIYA